MVGTHFVTSSRERDLDCCMEDSFARGIQSVEMYNRSPSDVLKKNPKTFWKVRGVHKIDVPS